MGYDFVGIGTLLIAFATIATVIIHSFHYKSQNEIAKRNINYNAMLQIMKIFNDPITARERHVVYHWYRIKKLYDTNDEILNVPITELNRQLPEIVASVRGSFDQIGKLVKEGYVDKNEFLDMYVDPIIRMWKVLERHIVHERTLRKHDHFMVNFRDIFNDAKTFWDMRFTGIPEPEPY